MWPILLNRVYGSIPKYQHFNVHDENGSSQPLHPTTRVPSHARRPRP